MLLVFFWDRPLELAFSTLGLAGMYISLEIFATSNNRSTNFGKKVCGGKDGEGCAKILNSDQYNLGVFTPNDFLFAFLLSSTTLLIISKEFTLPHLIVHSLAILVLFITIGIQAFIVKTWCRLCLVSSAVLLLQGVLVLTYFFYHTIEQRFTFKPIAFQLVLLGLLFGTYLIAVRQYRDIQKKNFSLGLSEMELLKFKRFPKIMRFILKDAEQLPVPNGAEQIVFGNMEARLQITIILSFTCSFCTNSFLKFYALYLKRGNEIRFRIIFNQYDTEDPKFIHLANFLIDSYKVNSPDNFLELLKTWYLKKNMGKSIHQDSQKGKALLSQHRDWCEKNHLYQTPTIVIDNSIVPYYYSADFLEDFIDVLKEELNEAP
ncbi:vitamin K epoxide reductase family protein [Flagellimonas aequoris]|uniref:vitamin K epoxide reductase family protein n=1 Tax=Flagellimonas aequoris TaxID=2306997 RepID=UPI0021D09C93|nr:vitamin K epoxide reductase family protein [Allomuricauda aequoris]